MMKVKRLIALFAALIMTVSFAACAKDDKKTESNSEPVSVAEDVSENKQTQSTASSESKEAGNETSESDKKETTSKKSTSESSKPAGKTQQTAQNKPNNEKKKTQTTKKQTTTKKQETINPVEIQREINNYIASKGWEVNSSLTPSNAGWSDKISINGDLSTKKYIIDNLKWLVDEFPPSFGKYCYFDGKYFYVLYD